MLGVVEDWWMIGTNHKCKLCKIDHDVLKVGSSRDGMVRIAPCRSCRYHIAVTATLLLCIQGAPSRYGELENPRVSQVLKGERRLSYVLVWYVYEPVCEVRCCCTAAVWAVCVLCVRVLMGFRGS